MRSLKNLAIAGLALTMMTACKPPKSAEYTGVPEVYVPPTEPVYPKAPAGDPEIAPKQKQATKEAFNLQGESRKKMDILFVIDDSKSMCGDQAKVKASINRFVNVFVKNTRIDFQIGVTSSWDSRLFGNASRKFKNGELRPVFGQNHSVRFVTNNTPNLIKTLNETIDIGYLEYQPNRPDLSGSENEEFFSPMLAAFSEEMLSGPNKGFSRPDADKGIIVITDADDGTNMSASDVSLALNRIASEGQNVTVLGAFSRLEEMNQFEEGKNPGLTRFAKPFKNGNINSCGDYTIDPGLVPALKGPAKLKELVTLKKGNAFDLNNSDFGARMAELGKKLVNRSLSYRVTLKNYADVSEPIVVSLNGKKLSKLAYSYDAELNQVVLSESLDLSNVDNFKVDVEYYILD
jgi:hypothetical protein